MYLDFNAPLGHVMTLANSIIGVGILAMPFCFQKCGVILSILLLLMSNFLTRVSCHYLIKSSILTRRKNFEFLAFHAFGFSGKLMVELCIIGYLMGTCIAYYVVVGDLGPQIISKLLSLNNDENLRMWLMIIVTIICVIPLGFLKNVDSLAVVCTASIGFYFCLVLKVMAESNAHFISSDWYNKVEYWKVSGVLQCLPIFCMSLSCQMQIFEVYETMPNASLGKMNSSVKSATNICTIVYIFVGFFGYVAFCDKEFSGNILLNLTPSFTSDVIKVGFVISVAFSFPLVIFPCRASLYSLLYRRNSSDANTYIPETTFKVITISIVIVTLLLGLLIPSIELVIGLVGSTIGVAICIMFPSSCFLKISIKESNEKLLAQFILIFGFSLMILGTYANLNAIDEKHSGTIIEIDEINLKKIDIVTEQVISIVEKQQIDEKLNIIDIPPDKITKTIIDNKNINKESINDVSKIKIDEKKSDIDQNAIQKEEHEIAMEIKNDKAKLDETEKLIEEKVNEIKKELSKQSENAQKLVEEKLNEISKKVEIIEKTHNEQIIEEKEENHKNSLNEKEKIKIETLDNKSNNKQIIYNIEKNEIPETKDEYKKDKIKLQQQNKENEIKLVLNKLPPLPIVKFNNSKGENISNSHLKKLNESTEKEIQSTISNIDEVKADVESIRRELLDVKSKDINDDITSNQKETRGKRDVDFDCKSSNNAVNLKGKLDISLDNKVISRDLKSVNEVE